MKIILLGAPGAGKGTQAVELSRRLQIPHISTGDIFRHNIRNATPLGQQVKEYLDSGRLVPDELTLSIVTKRLAEQDCQNGFLLDGFPRTLVQANALEAALPTDVALLLDIDQEILIDRLSGRLFCPACKGTFHRSRLPGETCPECSAALTQREDDKPATVRNRLEVYNAQTAPLIAYYQQAGKLLKVNANQSVEEVLSACLQALAAWST